MKNRSLVSRLCFYHVTCICEEVHESMYTYVCVCLLSTCVRKFSLILGSGHTVPYIQMSLTFIGI